MPWRLLYSLVEANWLQRSMKWIPYFRQVNWFCSLDCTSTLHFIFFSRLKSFFTLHSSLPMDVALTSYQPFHKIQNHEQDLNIFRQIIKIFLGQLHRYTLFYFQDFNLFSPQFKTLIKIVKWRDFSIAPFDLTWKLAIKLTTDRPANISALHELFSSNPQGKKSKWNENYWKSKILNRLKIKVGDLPYWKSSFGNIRY